MESIGIFINLDKPAVHPVLEQLLIWAKERPARILMPPIEAKALGHAEFAQDTSRWPTEVRACIVLGGDGTFLSAAEAVAPRGIPLIGVNLGRLGFFSELEQDQVVRGLTQLLDGPSQIDERMMLQAQLVGPGGIGEQFLALNDVVVSKGPLARLVHVEVQVDGQQVDTYPADGLIVATPTGSTAYSLSAGGPVITPNLSSILVTPICAHSLHARPLVISPTSELRVRLVGLQGDTLITIDGQRGRRLQPGDVLAVKRSAHTARLLRRPGFNFFGVLTRKLKEPDRPIG